MAQEFHISPIEQKRLDPEDKSDLLSYYKQRVHYEAEAREKQEKQARRKTKGKSKLHNLEEAIRRDAKERESEKQ